MTYRWIKAKMFWMILYLETFKHYTRCTLFLDMKFSLSTFNACFWIKHEAHSPLKWHIPIYIIDFQIRTGHVPFGTKFVENHVRHRLKHFRPFRTSKIVTLAKNTNESHRDQAFFQKDLWSSDVIDKDACRSYILQWYRTVWNFQLLQPFVKSVIIMKILVKY